MDADRAGPARRWSVHTGRQRRHRRPRRTGAGIPPAPGRPAGGVRPASLPRAATRGDRRDARDPRGNGPLATPLRHARPPGCLDGRRGARCPRRTSRMTDDRSLERAARSWLEAGPTRAPDHVVEAALRVIQRTPQERDRRVPWRVPFMIHSRGLLTGVATIAVALLAGVLILRPGGAGDVGSRGPSGPSS